MKAVVNKSSPWAKRFTTAKARLCNRKAFCRSSLLQARNDGCSCRHIWTDFRYDKVTPTLILVCLQNLKKKRCVTWWMLVAVSSKFKGAVTVLTAVQPPHLPWGLSYALKKLLKELQTVSLRCKVLRVVNTLKCSTNRREKAKKYDRY